MIIPSRRLCAAALAAVGSSACVTLPGPAPARQPAVSIAASPEKTWESALDELAKEGLSVRTVETNAGFIATETTTLPMFSTDASKWADCGTFAGFRYAPTAVDYTIFVRENSTGSSMSASARYRLLKTTGEPPTDCVSTGAFEESFAAAVKQRAETGR